VKKDPKTGKKPYPAIPAHIAIIMDGNGRWAERRGLKRVDGHRQGAETAGQITKECAELGVARLTLYAFSLENWKRPRSEVNTLMRLLKRFLVEKGSEMMEKNVRFTAIGRLHLLYPDTLKQLEKVVNETAGNTGLNLCLALSYGGRAEIVDTARELARMTAVGEIGPDDIDEELFARHLYQPGEDPDLLIRTAGEMRLSNFLLWQASYTEIYVTDACWPDFTKERFHEALEAFNKRIRKFGGLKAQARKVRNRSCTAPAWRPPAGFRRARQEVTQFGDNPLRTRIIVGASLLAGLALACWVDVTLDRAIVSSAVIVLLGMAALAEWVRFFHGRTAPYAGLLYAAGLAYPVLEGARILCGWQVPWLDPVFLSAFVIALFIQAVLSAHVEDGLDRIARTVLGFMAVYLFYRLIPVLLLDEEGGGLAATYGLVITAKSCDIGAYLTGSLLGKRKLIPRVSPGKTVAGAVGGLTLSTAVGIAVMILSGRGDLLFGACFGILLGLAAMFGDLAESVAKRCAGVKDSGSLLPAQGGILDLIDSLILAAPVGYVLLILF
jgi:undecaprenyl diphosphate synthase